MPHVRILPDRVANQIAAGEVIERPAAVVKELVENSLDAGATRVSIEFGQAGRSLIRVEDNGRGMSRDDALLSLERHATSKISEASDLDHLNSFGFRGEALPSIASVSRLSMWTRAEGEESGTEIVVAAGKLLHVREAGRAVGTSIEVAHLFEPVPARRKFLKSDGTESAHIVSCVRLYALACPAVSFTLIEDGRLVFRSPSCPSLPERVSEIFGGALAETLLSVESAEPGLRLSGLTGRPGSSRTSRHETVTFVNGRPVDSRTLTYALAEAYGESLPKGRYPAAFLFLECDPAAVDVNVHPAKREVRFRSEQAVRAFVLKGVAQALRDAQAAAGPPRPGPGSLAPQVPGGGQLRAPLSVGPPERAPYPQGPVPVKDAAEEAAPATPAGGPRWRFLALAHGCYALFETGAGIVILDRRAAHERIWFERLGAQFRAGSVPSQRLLLSVTLELDPVGSALLVDNAEFFRAHGFEIAEFGRNFFRLEAAPAWIEAGGEGEFVRDLLDALRDGRISARNPDLARDQLARLAASRAIRLPAAAGEAEMSAVLAELFSTRSPLTSPAGRPTFIEIGESELARRLQKS